MAGRPKEFDPEQALNAAVDLFWSKGFEGCSMSELLDEMAINRQSLYDTYGDKRELFMAVLGKYMDRVGTEIQTALSTGKSPLTRVQNFLKLLGERLSSGGGNGCLLTNTVVELGPHDAAIRKLVADRWRRIENAIADLLQQAIAEGELRASTRPRQVARLILAVMQGAIVLSKAEMRDSVKDAIRMASTLLKVPK